MTVAAALGFRESIVLRWFCSSRLERKTLKFVVER